MGNPLFKLANNHQPNQMPSMAQFKNALSKQDSSFLQRMQQIARQRGISEQAIQQGMEMLKSMK